MLGAGKEDAKPEPVQVPVLELTDVAQLPENTNCLTCTADGRFLGLAHSQGLSVWCASSFTRVAEWLQPQLELIFIQMTRMAEMTYLLGTVDDMGVARVFGFHSDAVHLLSIINAMEDVTVRSIFLMFDLHEGGHYGAASISCNGVVWLEVYQFPVEQWLRELETVSSQKKDENVTEGSGMKWSPFTLMMKISPPTLPTGKPLDFLTHCLTVDIIRSSGLHKDQSSFSSDAATTKKTHESPSCTQHFLLPCDGPTGDSKANPAGLPVAVAVWWSGSTSLLQYLLQKNPKIKSDVAPVPEILLPNAKEILCSAVSRCTYLIALGLEDATVCVWSRQSRSPVSIVLVPGKTITFSRIQFVDNWSVPAQDCDIVGTEPVGMLVSCKNGEVYIVTAGLGMRSSTVQLFERPKDSRDLPTVAISVPFLQAVSLIMQRSGKMFLTAAINRETVCYLTLPTSHQTASLYNPVYTLNAEQRALFIRGDQETSDLLESQNQSQLFVFYFSQSDIIKPHIDCPRQPAAFHHGTLEEICNIYLEQRAQSVEERNKALEQTWGKMQETESVLQHAHRSHKHHNNVNK
ncbi:WD repeat-containing protein 93 isoform X3 [Poecilia reticulata]|uniref:WD repeat-containing protein 93 isoform X3 n=1 Tax=Poecilia reticulata TaxID=8081 RepID=UPI0004A2D970|nr:PREDICTED: WD repeat-containing protein 93 isoform X3 [Poecilia reticulata]XP_008403015.1 PREDICTED: WD repeat-containing protein 93 isoform X3 [Poecilia reticulata]XP_008403016.1 PREDICTED: WD repeat-containing protein 93 isoform X3 [Poecilia reticulata]XP_017159680.1 PREDICTED: WD repeat-containing protein 93 isoform X3 [Poecilia reticulata]